MAKDITISIYLRDGSGIIDITPDFTLGSISPQRTETIQQDTVFTAGGFGTQSQAELCNIDFSCAGTSGYTFSYATLNGANSQHNSNFSVNLGPYYNGGSLAVTIYFKESGGGTVDPDPDPPEEDEEYQYRCYEIYNNRCYTIGAIEYTNSSSIRRPSLDGYNYLGYVYDSSWSNCKDQALDGRFDGTGTTCSSHGGSYFRVAFFYEAVQQTVYSGTIEHYLNGSLNSTSNYSITNSEYLTVSDYIKTYSGYHFSYASYNSYRETDSINISNQLTLKIYYINENPVWHLEQQKTKTVRTRNQFNVTFSSGDFSSGDRRGAIYPIAVINSTQYEDGYLRFTSKGNSGDPYINICSSSPVLNASAESAFNVITNALYKDDDSGEGRNFQLLVPMPKINETYYVCFSQFSVSVNSTITFNMEYVTSASLFYLNEDQTTFNSANGPLNSEITITSSGPAKTGYVFLGWSTLKNNLIPAWKSGDIINLTLNQTFLYPVYGQYETFYWKDNSNNHLTLNDANQNIQKKITTTLIAQLAEKIKNYLNSSFINPFSKNKSFKAISYNMFADALGSSQTAHSKKIKINDFLKLQDSFNNRKFLSYNKILTKEEALSTCIDFYSASPFTVARQLQTNGLRTEHAEYLEYSTSLYKWQKWEYQNTTISAVLQDDNKYHLYIRGIGNKYLGNGSGTTSHPYYGHFILNGNNIGVSGDLRTLLDWYSVYTNNWDVSRISASWPFMGLFKDCTSLTDVSKLKLYTSGRGCKGLFTNCSNLTTVPQIITDTDTLTGSIFRSLFENCTSLRNASKLQLPNKLSQNCFESMFSGCSSLTVPPEIPISNPIPENAYSYMFSNCTSLINPPKIGSFNGITLNGTGCFNNMFEGCSSLVKPISIDGAIINNIGTFSLGSMYQNCSSLQALPSIGNITVADTSTSVTLYLRSMFSGCSKIKVSQTQTFEYSQPYKIPNIDISSRGAQYVFKDTSGTFTSGDITPNTTYYLHSSNYIVY